MNYYNEFDPFAAQWLRNLIKAGLIPDGLVDERSITEVDATDLAGFNQCHFFAGIGGWSRALDLAGWDPARCVWTGSCPCQPFSVAGKRKGLDDARHLWPEFFRLIRQCRPATVFGEQVASAKLWLDGVCTDLEGVGYAFGAALLPACAVDAKHIRKRVWFVAHALGGELWEQPGRSGRADREGPPLFTDDGSQRPLAYADSQPSVRTTIPRQEHDTWDPEPDFCRVVDGIPSKVVEPFLRGFGNSIVPQIAAEFIRSCPLTTN